MTIVCAHCDRTTPSTTRCQACRQWYCSAHIRAHPHPEPLLATLPNGQEIRGTAQPDGTIHVDHWPAPTVTSTHPHGILGALLEHLDPEEYRRHFLAPD